MRANAFRSIVVFCAGVLAMPMMAVGQETRTTLTMAATVDSRTSLRVSSSHVRFDIVEGTPAEPAFVDFIVAARARADGDVVLTVEAVGRLERLSGGRSAGEHVVVWFQGEGEHAGALTETTPQVAGAWKGSGVRHGRVAFRLLGAPVAAAYVQELKFVLSAP